MDGGRGRSLSRTENGFDESLVAGSGRFCSGLDAQPPQLGAGDGSDGSGPQLGAAPLPIRSEQLREAPRDPRARERHPSDLFREQLGGAPGSVLGHPLVIRHHRDRIGTGLEQTFLKSGPGVGSLGKENPPSPIHPRSQLREQAFGIGLRGDEMRLDLPSPERLRRGRTHGGDMEPRRQSAAGQGEKGFHRVGGGKDDPLVKGQLGSSALQRPRIERRGDFQEGEELDVKAGGFEGGGQGFGLVFSPGDGDPQTSPPIPLSHLPTTPRRERGDVSGAAVPDGGKRA